METPSDELTWEDVAAICKVMGVEYHMDKEFNDFRVHRSIIGFGATFSNPQDALEYLTAELPPIENKYGNILRTKL